MNVYGATEVMLKKQATLNLAQAAGTYDLVTASGDVFIPLKELALYMATAGATFTSVAIQTNQTTPEVVLTAGEGAVASLPAQKIVVHANEKGIYLASGQKIQYTIVGSTGTGSMIATIFYRAVSAGATLT